MSDRLEIDMTLLAELFEDIDRHPPGVETRKVLVEQYIAANWTDSAVGAIEDLYKLRPNDDQVRQWYTVYCESSPKSSGNKAAPKDERTSLATKSTSTTGNQTTHGQITNGASALLPNAGGEAPLKQGRFQARYTTFRKSAASLLKDLTLGSNGRSEKGKRKVVHSTKDADATVVELTKRIKSGQNDAAKIAMDGLEKSALELKEQGQDEDTIRELTYKRVEAMVAALPNTLQIYPRIALMHLDHEIFHKKYVNTETMYGDDVAEIPRDNFLATEDGYAWDMDELQQAIVSGKGIMRNPLSKNMFTPADVQAILQHSLGSALGALQVEQTSLRKGVRPRTIEEMERIASILLDDMADDAMSSRKAIDEFMAYVATLPAQEQSALENLRVPARDSHTHQAFDGSIGETIRDAKGNKICFHKAGDFIRQAAANLRQAK